MLAWVYCPQLAQAVAVPGWECDLALLCNALESLCTVSVFVMVG